MADPVQTQPTSEPAQPATQPSSAAAAPPPPAGAPPAAPAAGSRPEGLADRFWDADKSEVKFGDLLGRFGELEAAKAEADSRLMSRPEAADKYELRNPGNASLPEGFEFKFDQNDPMFGIARNLAFEAGLSQTDFEQKMLKPYMELQGQMAHQADEFQRGLVEKANQELGANAEARRDAIKTWVGSKIGPTHLETLQHFLPVPGFVRFMEQVMRTGSGGVPGAHGGGRERAETGPTDDEWNRMTPNERMAAGRKADAARRAA